MIKSIAREIKGYLALLRGRPPAEERPRLVLAPEHPRRKRLIRLGLRKDIRHEACLNCGAPLSGDFCSACGQKDSDYRRPYWTFVEDLTDNLLSPDSRIWRTLAFLIFLPGAMTRDYVAGKRARFLPPIRMFLVSIIAFFFTVSILDVAIVKLTSTPVTPEEQKATLEKATAELSAEIEQRRAAGEDDFRLERREEQLQKTLAELEEINAALAAAAASPTGVAPEGSSEAATRLVKLTKYDTDFKMFSRIMPEDKPMSAEALSAIIEDEPIVIAAGTGDWEERLEGDIKRGLKNAAEDPRRLNQSLNRWVPIIMGVFVPMFALFLRFFYLKRGHYLYNHLVFSLHFHTYLFLLLTFFVLAQVFLGSAVSTWMFVAAVPLYLLIALKVASGNGWIRSFFKFLVIAFFYVIGFSVMLAAVIVTSLSEA
ncbi:MAG TPA: DUF3667 domain-containing protein [Sphingomonadales bacterium]|nr:DUF3667 domain-containing protein [Sphingomonadales bacterium]